MPVLRNMTSHDIYVVDEKIMNIFNGMLRARGTLRWSAAAKYEISKMYPVVANSMDAEVQEFKKYTQDLFIAFKQFVDMTATTTQGDVDAIIIQMDALSKQIELYRKHVVNFYELKLDQIEGVRKFNAAGCGNGPPGNGGENCSLNEARVVSG